MINGALKSKQERQLIAILITLSDSYIDSIQSGFAVSRLHSHGLGHDDSEWRTNGHPVAVESSAAQQSPVRMKKKCRKS